jgi:hypothetical protein
MSVFLYEISNKPTVALTLMEATIAQALEKIEDSAEGEFNETHAIIDQMRANMSLWLEQMQTRLGEIE